MRKDFETEFKLRGAYHHNARGFDRWFYNRNYSVLATYVKESRQVLDLACGDGCLTQFLPNTEYVGIDISKTGLKLAKELTHSEFVRADMRCLPFRDAVFSAVVCSLSLQYLNREEVQKALLEVARVVQVDGKFSLSYPNSAKIKKIKDKNRVEILSFDEIVVMLRRAGFNVTKSVGINPYIPHINKLVETRILSFLGWFVLRVARVIRFFPKNAYHYALYCKRQLHESRM